MSTKISALGLNNEYEIIANGQIIISLFWIKLLGYTYLN